LNFLFLIFFSVRFREQLRSGNGVTGKFNAAPLPFLPRYKGRDIRNRLLIFFRVRKTLGKGSFFNYDERIGLIVFQVDIEDGLEFL
jgi:hypothetical protein